MPQTVKSASPTAGEFLRRTLGYLRPYWTGAVANILLALLTVGFYFTFPQITQYIIDEAITKRNLAMLLPAVATLFGAFLLYALSNALRIVVNSRFGQNVIFDMRRKVFAHLTCLPVGFYDRQASGDLITRIIDDVASVHRVLIDGVERAATTVLSVVIVFVILLLKNVQLTLLALLPLLLLTAGSLWYTMKAHPSYRRQRKEIGAFNAFIMDALQGIRQIKAYGRQEHENRRFEERSDRVRKSTIEVMNVWAVYSPAMSFVGSMGMVLVLWAGAPMVVGGTLSLGELVSFLFYLTLFYEPIGRIDGLNQMLQSARASSERLFALLDTAPEVLDARGGAYLDTPVRGDIRFERVGFAYADDRPVLRDISFHARPGSTVAIVGPTGAGKSTIVNLLPAFYRPTGGRILVDAQDIAGVSPGSLREQIGIVSQEPFLFNGTVRENILYGKLDASEEELLVASKAANCHDFIAALPMGYETLVGERGIRFSAGEKQRISIARALLKDAPILILDEATASVDNETEKLIQEALQRLMSGRTSLLIAHRLNTIRNADLILVIHHGEIVEEGSHQELIERNGRYAKLSMIADEEPLTR